MLVGEANAARTAVNLLDLGKPDHTLASWPVAVKEALDKHANNAQAQHTEAVLRTITASLNPHTLQTAQARLGNMPRQTIMVVEDDPSTNLLLTMLLDDMVKTCSAANAVQAAQAYEIYIPALVFLDLGLPDMNGLTLLKHIKAADANARVIILTANATRENLQAARTLGADGFLAKPFTRAKLQEALQHHRLIRPPVV